MCVHVHNRFCSELHDEFHDLCSRTCRWLHVDFHISLWDRVHRSVHFEVQQEVYLLKWMHWTTLLSMFFLITVKALISDHMSLMFWRLHRDIKELQIQSTDKHEHLNWTDSYKETHCWLFYHNKIHHDVMSYWLNYCDIAVSYHWNWLQWNFLYNWANML